MSVSPGFFSFIKSSENLVRGYLIGSTHIADRNGYVKFVETIYSVMFNITHVAVETIADLSSFENLQQNNYLNAQNILNRLSNKEITKISKYLEGWVSQKNLNKSIKNVEEPNKRARNESIHESNSIRKKCKIGEHSQKKINIDRDKEIISILNSAMNLRRKETFPEETFFNKFMCENRTLNIKLISLENQDNHSKFLLDVNINKYFELFYSLVNCKDQESANFVLNREEINASGKAWLENDHTICDQLKNKSETIISNFHKRSINQVNSMDLLLSNPEVIGLFCVGILHLPGTNGVIEGLKLKGWKIEPILIED